MALFGKLTNAYARLLLPTNLSPSKLIAAIVGATGGQNGSVADALLESGQSQVRAVLPNLAQKKTPFMKCGPEEAEKLELIQSTLPLSAKPAQNKFHTPHFEAKAGVDEYIFNEPPALAAKTRFLWVAYYAASLTFPLFTPNLIKASGQYGKVQPIQGSTSITTPSLTLAGKYVLAEAETLTNEALLERWGKITGKSTFSGAAWETSWSKPGVTALRKEDLGIDVLRLTGLDAALLQTDWNRF
ncbi:hypothetical protein BDW71DRAFT_196631 [Aspergillus fruticulosus]